MSPTAIEIPARREGMITGIRECGCRTSIWNVSLSFIAHRKKRQNNDVKKISAIW